jgi:hypothetical protein
MELGSISTAINFMNTFDGSLNFCFIFLISQHVKLPNKKDNYAKSNPVQQQHRILDYGKNADSQ